MIYDLRKKMSLSGEMRVCYLAEDSAHITSPSFKVYIPDVMPLIDKNQTDYQIQQTDSLVLNQEKSEFANPINCQGYVIARSACPYGHRLDGWIPKFTVDTIEHPTGESDEITAQSTKGSTDGVPQHPPQPITKKFSMFKNKILKTIFKNSTFTSSRGVDFQNIHNKVIKRGHKLYGAFVVGEQNQFVIFAIDNVVPYMSGTDVRPDGDYPDNSFDGGSTNTPN